MKPHILIVDDEVSLCLTFECFLLDEGYNVTLAHNYNDALKKISEKNYDVIFSDIRMGEKNGIDLLRMIKKKDLISPVIMITGYPDVETASQSIRCGAFDYIVKPLKKGAILKAVKQALQFKRVVEEKEKYRANLEAIFESVQEGIITVDKNLNILEINEAAKNICNLSDDCLGKPFKAVIAGCSREECIQSLKKTIITKKVVELYNLESINKEKPEQIVSLNISPLLRNTIDFSGAVMVIRDETELREVTKKLQERGEFHNIIGKSKKIRQMYSLLEKLAIVPTTVLIVGESGTGKELVAEALHYKGNRKNNPLIKINCSALPENLLESELFGHVKGAFTGAIKNRTGWFQKAHKGTIFLDEIGDITPALQLRLLRVLQERDFVPVGASKSITVDVRVIASTNQDIRAKIYGGEFREDLYYRLNVIELLIPPLRERKKDIPLLVEHFIKKYNEILNKNIKGISKNVMEIFMGYYWPGNIRELEHVIEHAIVISNQFLITENSLPNELIKDSALKARKTCRVKIEKALIIDTLKKCKWKKTRVAEILGIDRKTVYRKMEKYGIPLKKPE